jgi:hypothetical protein
MPTSRFIWFSLRVFYAVIGQRGVDNIWLARHPIMICVMLLSTSQNSCPTSASMLVQKSLPMRERLQNGFRTNWQMTKACT